MNKRIKSLDGMRAVAVMMVVFFHMSYTKTIPVWDFIIFKGITGVIIFFVISGYLITTLLLNEEEKTGKISLRKFYVKRFFRIVPAFIFYIAVISIISRWGLIKDFNPGEIIYAALFMGSVFPGHIGWPLGHSWSLSVEALFYLFWPFVLLMLKSRKYRSIFALVIIFMVILYRPICYHQHGSTFSLFYNADALMTGCLLALNQNKLGKYLKATGMKKYILWALLICTLMLNTCVAFGKMGIITVPLGPIMLSCFTACIIYYYSICEIDGPVFSFLNSKIVNYLGIISYSIYVWQQVFMQSGSAYYCWRGFPVNLIAIIAVSSLSFILIETPVKKLQKYFY